MKTKLWKDMVAYIISIYMIGMTGCTGYTTSVKEEKYGIEPIYPKAPPKLNIFDFSAVNDTSKWGNLYSHDPSIFKDDNGYYYVYSTDVGMAGGIGIQIKKSKDMINWEFIGHALDSIPTEAIEWAHPFNLWAPDIIKVGNEYRLYYAASSFGSQKSAIMLAVANNPEGPFTDKGIVLKTDIGDPVNAIDPNIVEDVQTGDIYMAYGSFWGGINIIKINKNTGLVAENGFGKNIAVRLPSVQGAIEGVYIKYNPDTKYYYLFVSYGSLSSDYNVRVARSKNIMGPYVDYNGTEMIDTSKSPNDVGLKITTGYKFENGQGWMALGHNSILNDNGKWYIVHHARPENELDWPYLQIRTMVWTDDGWPIVSPEMYAGETIQKIDEKLIAGNYERVKFENSTLDLSTKSSKMYFKSNKTCFIDDKKGKWNMDGNNTLFVTLENTIETYKIIPSWDWENWKTTLVLTGMDKNGICIWGKKIGK